MSEGARIQPVILCGGGGSRLWPLSTPRTPKQFLALTGDASMIAETAARVSDPDRFERLLAVGAARHEAALRTSLPEARLVLEPVGRNSAPAIAAACLLSSAEALVLVLPSDHHIADPNAFLHAIETARPRAEAGDIVTFGIEPDHPATGYGYIEAGAARGDVLEAKRFVEKPDRETAQRYLAEGGFYWNAGIFLFRASAMIEALKAHAPGALGAAGAALPPEADGAQIVRLDRAAFEAGPSISIDYAVMEKAENVSVAPVSMGWTDLGDHRALHRLKSPSGANVFEGPVIADGVESCFVRSEGPLVGLANVSGLAVIATRKGVLVTPVERAAEIRTVAETALASGAAAEIASTVREEVRDWLFQTCLPGWADRAFDAATGGFVEGLDVNTGEPLPDWPRRGRVSARQTFAFARAARLGFERGADLVRAGLKQLDGPARSAKGGWAHALAPDGTVADDRRSLYDHAFVALAGAEAYAALGEPHALAIAEEAFAVIDETMADQTHGGWVEAELAPEVKLTNPHMHLMEAALAMHAATGEASALRRAEAIAELFEARMFDPASGAVRETLSRDWNRLDTPEGRLAEPGHAYEWAVLLDQLSEVSGRDTVSWRRRLIAAADRTAASGAQEAAFASACVSLDGEITDPERRLWPQLERLRARLAHPETAAPGDTARQLNRILEHYIRPGPAWGWIDKLDRDDRPIADRVPASMLYHVMTGLGDVAASA